MSLVEPPGSGNAELAAKVEELAVYVQKIELRLAQLSQQVAQLTAFNANIRESLKVMGVTDGYAPPEQTRADFDPSVG